MTNEHGPRKPHTFAKVKARGYGEANRVITDQVEALHGYEMGDECKNTNHVFKQSLVLWSSSQRNKQALAPG